ncbi:MAG: DUF3500 domain-containing protein [bacterium]|nr:DUF3500 domain-containing protein [bacterium]
MQTHLALGVTSLLALASGLALWDQESATTGGGVEIAAAAEAWLAALDDGQRKQAVLPLTAEERTKWHFVPGRYKGAELGSLNPAQRELGMGVLRAMLSARGYDKTLAIVELENVLRRIESKPGRDASHRDPDRYALLVLGEPKPDAAFAVRFQGHHVSLQVQIRAGRVIGHTPHFLGTNPHEIVSGKRRGQRVLGAEEDLARALLLLLTEEQLERAVIAEQAPPDVILGPAKPPSALGDRKGLPWSEMNATQRGVLWRLIQEYASVWHGELADRELARVRGQLDVLCFAWAGGQERGQGHYYRIHGSHFAIEYDNTQNGANHVHTVWRDFENDFGGEWFERHLREQHGR